MQTIVIFSIITAVIYFLTNVGMNRLSEEKKTPKVIMVDSCIVFLSVMIAIYVGDFLGVATLSIKQKGGTTSVFTSKPEF
jgi:hypothetical protein